MHTLIVTFKPEELPDYEFDVSLDALVGTEHRSCDFKNGIRQMCWSFENQKEVKAASRRVKKFNSPLKLNVEVVDSGL